VDIGENLAAYLLTARATVMTIHTNSLTLLTYVEVELSVCLIAVAMIYVYATA